MPRTFRPYRARNSRLSHRYAGYSTTPMAKSFVLLLTRLLGFLAKVKKLLETVCHNCGKIKANTVSHPSWDGKSYMAICADAGPV